jgi:hypothetical protein
VAQYSASPFVTTVRKTLDPAITLEMYQSLLNGNEDLTDDTVGTAVQSGFPVAVDLRQLVLFHATQEFEIGKTTLPAIENHQFRLKSALFGLLDHLLKVVILAQTIFGLVVQSKITRQPALAIGLDQQDQVDALHQSILVAKLVPADQHHVRSIGLFRILSSMTNTLCLNGSMDLTSPYSAWLCGGKRFSRRV